MSTTHNDNRPLRHHVLSHFQRNQQRWERLRGYISIAKELPGEDHAPIKALKQERPFLRRHIRKHLARLRRRYRKNYQAATEHIVKEWRPEYERRLARARPYQRDISGLMKREAQTLQAVHGIIKRINVLLGKFVG